MVIPEKLQRRDRLVPLHTFEVLGEYFLFDTSNCIFFRIDRLTHDFLRSYKSRGLTAALETLRRNLDPSDFSHFLRELKTMHKFGLFDAPRTYINLNSAKRKLHQVKFSCSLRDIQLILTEKCNLSCRYCYCRAEEKKTKITPHGEMSKEKAQSAVDLLLRQDGDELMLTFFGGEPLLNKKLMYYLIDFFRCLW